MGRPTISGPNVPARGIGPIHARHTASGPTTSSVIQSVPDTQPPGTDLQLADAVNSNGGHAGRYGECPEYRDKTPERAVREDNEPGLAANSGYGPSLWAGQMDTPKQRLSYDEMLNRRCGRRGETEVCYMITDVSGEYLVSMHLKLR